MRRAILFRYHHAPEVARNRIELLRRCNPGVPVWAMYGGEASSAPDIGADHHYLLRLSGGLDARWRHGDICAREWFIEHGHQWAFDMLHLVEWDLLLLAPLEQLFGHVRDGVALTHVRSLATLRAEGWVWARGFKHRARLALLRRHLRRHFSFALDDAQQKAGVFGAACLSRAFLQYYSRVAVPRFCHDEVRMPAFAQAFGMRVHDTGLRTDGLSFRCSKRALSPGAVAWLARETGAAAFHPVVQCIDVETVCSSDGSVPSLPRATAAAL